MDRLWEEEVVRFGIDTPRATAVQTRRADEKTSPIHQRAAGTTVNAWNVCFQIYPLYLDGCFFIGSWARYDKAMYYLAHWLPARCCVDKGIRWGNNLFHVGVY